MANKNNVGAFSPRIGGGIWYAPKGTTLPADATSDLDEAFKDFGYITTDGVTETIDGLGDGEPQQAWGGVTLRYISDSGATHTFGTELLEITSIDAARVLYGADNITEVSDGFSVKINPSVIGSEEYVFVIDTVDKVSKKFLRIVIGAGTVVPSGDTKLTHTELNFVEVTITAVPDANGVTVEKFIASIPAPEGP